jgi:hypothetical protein
MNAPIPASHFMNIMNVLGHTKISWNPDVAVEVDAARSTFEDLTAEGYNAFRVDGEGRQGTRLSSFDPSATEILLIPQLRGG